MINRALPQSYSSIKSDIKGYRQKPVHNKRVQLYYLNKYGNAKTVVSEQMHVNSRVYMHLNACIKKSQSSDALKVTKEEWDRHSQNIQLLLASSGISFYLN